MRQRVLDVVKLRKRLAVVEFDPESERGYDEAILTLERKAVTSGVAVGYLPTVIQHGASFDLSLVIGKVMDKVEMWFEFVEQLVLALFPFSHAHVDLLKELQIPDRCSSVVLAGRWDQAKGYMGGR